MSKFIINGGNKLAGEIRVQGAKNAVLPILAATVLNKGQSLIHDCPNILDVNYMIRILQCLGCTVDRNKNSLMVDTKNMDTYKVPENLVREMRSSIILLGSILARCHEVLISFPGGCSIGSRPIDIHLKALKQLGVKVEERAGFIYCSVDKIKGNLITLDFPSVGATENIMLTTALAEGETIICNSAKEPEIIDLQNFLNSMGANISGAGTDKIVIKGVKELHETEYTVIPDRIVAGTYLMASAITGGNITLQNVDNSHICAVLSRLKEMNCNIEEGSDYTKIIAPERLNAIDIIRTQIHPGFPTDMQAQTMTSLTVANGTSIIIEKIFDARFNHVDELVRMGADITVESQTAVIRGVKELSGTEVEAKDLRGGAALILAGLKADGRTTVLNSYHVLRGYEDICMDLSQLGANIKHVD